ncbi:MAG: deoxyhypusine synthase family protein [Pseudohaliea sp.]
MSCSGANLEEDRYNLVAHDHYERVPHYRNLSDAGEQALLDRHLNRATDTCIPEEEAIRRIEEAIVALWQRAGETGEARFPHEYFFKLLRSGVLEKHCQIDPKDSWLVAAAEKNLPMVVPGWEDSTTGNIFAARVITSEVERSVMKGGIDYVIALADWYASEGGEHGFGFFQVGGGIAGGFPICVVPMLEQNLGRSTPKWSYFCQLSDSTTSYGSYSGAVPNEKITRGKLAVDTPRFIIESDASIVVPWCSPTCSTGRPPGWAPLPPTVRDASPRNVKGHPFPCLRRGIGAICSWHRRESPSTFRKPAACGPAYWRGVA